MPSAPATSCGPPHWQSKRPPSLAVARRLSPRPAACHGHSVALTAASLATAITCRGQFHLPRPGQRAPPLLASALVSQVTCRDWTRRHPSHLRRPEFRVPRRLSESRSFAAAGPHSLRPASLAIRLTAKRYSPLPAVARHGPSPSLAAASRRWATARLRVTRRPHWHPAVTSQSPRRPPSHSPQPHTRLTRRPRACRQCNHSGSPSRRDRDRPRRRPRHSRGQESLAAARLRVTRCGLPSLAAAHLTGYRHGPMSLATSCRHSPRFASLAITRRGPSGPSRWH